MSKVGKLTITILKSLALGGALVIASQSPKGRQAISKLLASEVKRRNRYYLKQRLRQMAKHGLIRLSEENVILTAKGEALLKQVEIEEIKLESRPWDKKWHLVAYDIPDKQKTAREAFRHQLIKWGFVQVQESVWVIYFECKEEVAIVAQHYGISPFVIYMHAADLPMASRLKIIFNLNV